VQALAMTVKGARIAFIPLFLPQKRR